MTNRYQINFEDWFRDQNYQVYIAIDGELKKVTVQKINDEGVIIDYQPDIKKLEEEMIESNQRLKVN